MVDFSYLSDTDESAVEEILAEAADHIALKQISAINLSGVSGSVLPQHLEARFRRLQTFPSSLPQPQPQPQPSKTLRPSNHAKSRPVAKPSANSTGSDSGSELGGNPDPKSGSKAKSRSGSAGRRGPSRSGSPSPSPSSSSGSFSWLEGKNWPKLKSERGLGSGRGSGSGSPPPKKMGCVWCFPRMAWREKSFGKRSGVGLDGNDDVLEDLGLGSLSRKEQEKVLKRAAKEEMKISEEAEKIVKWAKQVSSRMEAFGVVDDDDDELPYK